MKQEVLEKIKQRIVYIEKVEELKSFWTTNSEYIKKSLLIIFHFQILKAIHKTQLTGII